MVDDVAQHELSNNKCYASAFNYILYFIIIIGLKSHGCAKWVYQIAKNSLDFKKK